jgi:hypothetical protein
VTASGAANVWCGAPDGVVQVRRALFELVDQVVDELAYT